MSRRDSGRRATPVDTLPPRYYTRIDGADGGGYRELLTPPTLTPPVRLSLVKQIEALRSMTHLHAPGDGWHYLPSRAEYLYNGSYWFASLATSEGPILANVLDLCRELGISFAKLYRSAYPDEGPTAPKITKADRAMRSRPVTIKDARKVLADLESVNYHALRGVLADALKARGIPTSE
jgi:hypothetical protein